MTTFQEETNLGASFLAVNLFGRTVYNIIMYEAALCNTALMCNRRYEEIRTENNGMERSHHAWRNGRPLPSFYFLLRIMLPGVQEVSHASCDTDLEGVRVILL